MPKIAKINAFNPKNYCVLTQIKTCIADILNAFPNILRFETPWKFYRKQTQKIEFHNLYWLNSDLKLTINNLNLFKRTKSHLITSTPYLNLCIKMYPYTTKSTKPTIWFVSFWPKEVKIWFMLTFNLIWDTIVLKNDFYFHKHLNSYK